jgi:hypothetical protein
MKVVEVPGNIKFDLTSNIAKLIYTNVEITNFKGNLKIADQKVSFDNISFNTLGSAIKINGFYETTNSKSPSVAMDFDIKDLDIQKSFVTFNTIKRIAPIAEKTKGTFSANFKMISKLDTKMNPVYETMFAEGVLTVPHAEVNSVGVMVKLADALKQPSYKQMAINNVRIQFKVEKGRIYTKPFDLNAAGQKLTLSGSTGLDQTIDYKGTALIPRKELGAINNQLNALMSSLNQKAGSSIKLSENIPLGIIMGGTFSNPTVSTNLEDLAKSEARSLQDQAAAELERQKRELEAKARAEADRIKKEVEDKARAEANRIKAEAEARAKAEQDKLKKQAEEEAKKKLKGLFGK